jgi:hypothetical protein
MIRILNQALICTVGDELGTAMGKLGGQGKYEMRSVVVWANEAQW